MSLFNKKSKESEELVDQSQLIIETGSNESDNISNEKTATSTSTITEPCTDEINTEMSPDNPLFENYDNEDLKSIIPSEDSLEDSDTPNINDAQQDEEVQNFLDMFSKGRQEEVKMADSSFKNIEEDIVLEKPKKKISIKPLIIMIIFIIFIFLAIIASYIFATFNIVTKYHIDGAEYYNDHFVNFSIVKKGDLCDISTLKPNDTILYTEGDTNTLIGDYKAFKIKEVKKSSVYGYDYNSKEYMEISCEKICYKLSGEDIQTLEQNDNTNSSTSNSESNKSDETSKSFDESK